ncbi:conserved Plasmodium protein, unknown function [Plasmodium berghei]|uniref:Uncharacterized protein n=2 Tax=Plasmodium berghei TaxID=5821 RepID=A0A509ABG9_PLABA|nr:conserved Plasmodium protein, unknown function [Plasmodium berghei ANKA]CXH87440.1 conserved Plasmodium protein, unknown function [Plasmodium berghei]SCL90094.1 conserved Plasmodium protein, unknown function [Plasmodium berghei]SCM15217.1 conserved Plasmodium protein, unknown function [Plasmodium berghei]SCM17012.1 conserved Plasmodium protein, unknown function [Plasmodium berghei]SCN21866.1 conserved Plasmodium protein, unknown function [Plasmodium berghei]|eukprot:XP_034419793.1 conserved Plasmodium protein, unknown function [Plasmodium berghei ANKA]
MKYFIVFNIFLYFYKINKYNIEDNLFSHVLYQKEKHFLKLNLKHLLNEIEIINRGKRILYDLSRKRRRNRRRGKKRKGFGKLWKNKNKRRNKRRNRKDARRRKRKLKRAERKRKKKQKKQMKKERKKKQKEERKKKQKEERKNNKFEGQSNELINQENELKNNETILDNKNGNKTLNNNYPDSKLTNNEVVENEEEEDDGNKYNDDIKGYGENQKYNYAAQNTEQTNIPKSINSPYYKEIDSNIKIVNVAKLEHESKHEIIDKIKKALEVLQ